MVRKSSVSWKGSGKDGKGSVTTQSGVLKDTQMNWHTRFEEGIGTNPEELLAAAHASCFTMKVSFLLAAKNFISESIDTTCSVTVDNGAITLSHLDISAKVPGITMEQFQEIVLDAKENCVVSKLFNTLITLKATLAS